MVVSSVPSAKEYERSRSGSTASTWQACSPQPPMSMVKRCPTSGRTSPAAHHFACSSGSVSARQTREGGWAMRWVCRMTPASTMGPCSPSEGLDEVEEVPAPVLEDDADDGTLRRRLATEDHAALL